jgi:uncharacterized membrane protein
MTEHIIRRTGGRPRSGVWVMRLETAHRFMERHAFYSTALSSGLACGILAGRVYLSHSPAYAFLIWNLYLAWLPYLFSLWAGVVYRRFHRQWWTLIIPISLWLVFFPNAPYLVTDLWHLRERPPVPMWYDIGLLATFAWTGCFLGIVSLRTIQQLVRACAGRLAGWLFAIAALGLSGVGIYLGRFLRWNSWDLFTNPISVLADVASWLVHPRYHMQMFGFTLLFTAFMAVCYLTFMSVQQPENL